MANVIRIPMTCIADYLTKVSKSPAARIRPFKFPAAGVIPTIYYAATFRTIDKFHTNANDPAVPSIAIKDMRRRALSATSRQAKDKFLNNAKAIEAYMALYGARKFKILRKPNWVLRIGNLEVKARPDILATEGNRMYVFKVGAARQSPRYIDILLSLLRKAAAANHYPVKSRDVIYMNIRKQSEIRASGGLLALDAPVLAAAADIENIWPTVL
jgi:hypothetical protein